MAPEPKRPKFETMLAYTAVVVTFVSILSILATLLLTATGATSIPVLFAQLPLIGLPIGFVLIMIMLIAAIMRRGKENRS